MNIALLTEKFPPDFGGLAISAGRLAGGLAAGEDRVTVFHLTRAISAGQVETEQVDGVVTMRIGASARTDDSLASWFDLVCAAHVNWPFDIIHGFYLVQAGFVAALAGRFLNVPAIISARGNDLDRAIFDPGKAAHILYSLHHATTVTANTTELARKAAALGVSQPAVVIPNGVDAALFSPGSPDIELAHRLGVSGDLAHRPLIGFTGEARAKKGLDTLLSAMEILAGSTTHADTTPRLLLVGGARKGPDRDALEAFRAALPGLVVVVPPQPLAAMPALYRLLDVLALPSRHDGLPNSLLEGMACGLAIAATSVGGMADTLRDGDNALIVPPAAPQALVDALERLINSPSLRTRLGAQARADVSARFSLAQELAGYRSLYERLAKQ